MKIAAAIITILLVAVGLAFGQSMQPDKPESDSWTGTLRDETRIDEKDLRAILKEIKNWREDVRAEGLDPATLDFGQDDAQPLNTDPRRRMLSEAKLSGADFSNDNLSGADLFETNLTRANLRGANLSGVEFLLVDLTEANLSNANLSGANLSYANLSGAELYRADLIEADLFEANLTNANLLSADLTGADLTRANLTGTNFEIAWVTDVWIEEIRWDKIGEDKYKPGSPIDTPNWSSAKGLHRMRYGQNSESLERLRAAFQSKGLSGQARQVSVSLSRTKNRLLLDQCFHEISACQWWRALWAVISIVFAEWPMDYGEEPLRALWILLISIAAFGALYLVLPRIFGSSNQRLGNFVRKTGTTSAVLDVNTEDKAIHWGIAQALWFSFFNATQFGTRAISLQTIFRRLQREEHVVEASGLLRIIAVVQTLLSLYLLTPLAVDFF